MDGLMENELHALIQRMKKHIESGKESNEKYYNGVAFGMEFVIESLKIVMEENKNE